MIRTLAGRLTGATILAVGLLAGGVAAAQTSEPLLGGGFGPATGPGSQAPGGGFAGQVPGGGGGGGGGGGPMARIGQMLQQLDANGDGAVTQAEADAARRDRFASVDLNGDGAVDVEELMAAEDSRRAQRFARMLQRLDANADGRVTADEFTDSLGTAGLFARLDRDQDGTISPAEIEQLRAMVRQRMTQGGAGQGGFGQRGTGQGGFGQGGFGQGGFGQGGLGQRGFGQGQPGFGQGQGGGFPGANQVPPPAGAGQ